MKRKTLIVVLLTTLGAGFALAQTNTPPVVSGGLPSLSMIPAWLQVLITPITFGLIALAKNYLPKLPSFWLPIAAAFLGALVNSLSDLIGLWGTQGLANSALAGAALGALATWLHQIGKQSGIIPPTPPIPSTPTSATAKNQ